MITDKQIREVFLAHGFTIKPGCDDLKPYVYAAAKALLALAAPSVDNIMCLHDKAAAAEAGHQAGCCDAATAAKHRDALRTAVAALAAPAPTFEPDPRCTGRRACEHHGACLYGCTAAPAPQPEPLSAAEATRLWNNAPDDVRRDAASPATLLRLLRFFESVYRVGHPQIQAPSVEPQENA